MIDSGIRAARPRVRDVVRAEWRRLGEPPAGADAVTQALRSRPAARASAFILVVAAVLVAWLLGPHEVAVVSCFAVTVIGLVTGWRMRGRTRDEFEAEQRERVERIQERDRVRRESGSPRRPA